MNTQKNRVVLVTGAKQGMGRAIARRLASDGALVAVNDKDLDSSLRDVAQEIKGFAAAADLTDFAEVKRMINDVIEQYGQLDAVVAQHAYMSMNKFEDHEEEDWWKVIRTNLMGTYAVLRESVPHLVASKGKIVVTSSYWGLIGWPEASAYSSSKAGLVALVKSLARELAPQGVLVNAIAPGVVNTPQLEVDAKNLNVSLEKVIEMYGKEVPIGRVGEAEEIAAAVAFLLSPEQNAIVGQIISVNGGEFRGRA
jgi:NAD(P)-dependent dehydrogenase (short-subunit alcohol dehydrogenase family)